MNNDAYGLSFNRLCELFHAQVKSAEMWIREYERYKDASSVRNAAFAIGKAAGIAGALESTGEQLPDDIIESRVRLNDIWANLSIEN